MPMLRVVNASVAAVNTASAEAPAARARSNPRRLGTRTGKRRPGAAGSRGRSSSASANCGIARGETKLVASISARPASASSEMKRTLSSVATGTASFWRPSRGPTS